MTPYLPIMRMILLGLLLAGCAGAPPPTPEQMAGFRSSSSTMALDRPSGPAVLLSNDVGTPLAGISVSCKPDPSGLNATCRRY